MVVIKKNVYYCGFCKKHGLSAGVISKHEKYCTANPKRECRMCKKITPDQINGIIEGFKKTFTIKKELVWSDHIDENVEQESVIWTGAPVTLKEIRYIVKDCPNCILAVLRQTGMNREIFGLENFDYKEEFIARMAELNSEQKESEYY